MEGAAKVDPDKNTSEESMETESFDEASVTESSSKKSTKKDTPEAIRKPEEMGLYEKTQLWPNDCLWIAYLEEYFITYPETLDEAQITEEELPRIMRCYYRNCVELKDSSLKCTLVDKARRAFRWHAPLLDNCSLPVIAFVTETLLLEFEIAINERKRDACIRAWAKIPKKASEEKEKPKKPAEEKEKPKKPAEEKEKPKKPAEEKEKPKKPAEEKEKPKKTAEEKEKPRKLSSIEKTGVAGASQEPQVPSTSKMTSPKKKVTSPSESYPDPTKAAFESIGRSVESLVLHYFHADMIEKDLYKAVVADKAKSASSTEKSSGETSSAEEKSDPKKTEITEEELNRRLLRFIRTLITLIRASLMLIKRQYPTEEFQRIYNAPETRLRRDTYTKSEADSPVQTPSNIQTTDEPATDSTNVEGK